MRKTLIAACAALSLSIAACAPGAGIKSPAPLAQTTADEKALIVAVDTFDVLLTAIDGLRDSGVLVPGSPRALRVQSLIRTAQAGFNTARGVQRGLSTENPVAALASASSAIAEISAILKGAK
jgi:hypothetical protein